MTLDCSGINKYGSGRFRTEADRPDFQTCYFNVANDEEVFNKFVSKRINDSESNDRIQFKIIHLKSKMNREKNFNVTGTSRLDKNNGTKNQWKRGKKSYNNL